MQQYLVNYCRDLIAICLKSMIDTAEDIKYLNAFMKLFFKGF